MKLLLGNKRAIHLIIDIEFDRITIWHTLAQRVMESNNSPIALSRVRYDAGTIVRLCRLSLGVFDREASGCFVFLAVSRGVDRNGTSHRSGGSRSRWQFYVIRIIETRANLHARRFFFRFAGQWIIRHANLKLSNKNDIDNVESIDEYDYYRDDIEMTDVSGGIELLVGGARRWARCQIRATVISGATMKRLFVRYNANEGEGDIICNAARSISLSCLPVEARKQLVRGLHDRAIPSRGRLS